MGIPIPVLLSWNGSAGLPAAAMPPDEGSWDGGARLGCCMLTGGALLEGRINVVGPVFHYSMSQKDYVCKVAGHYL